MTYGITDSILGLGVESIWDAICLVVLAPCKSSNLRPGENRRQLIISHIRKHATREAYEPAIDGCF